MAIGECDAKGYDLRTRRQGLRSSRDPTLNGWKVRIFVEGIPANGFTYSVDSEVYQDAAIDGVPEDLVAGLMETVERDFRRGLAQELVAAEKATDDDIVAETINSNHAWSAWRLTAPAQMTPGTPLVRLARKAVHTGHRGHRILRAGRWQGLDCAERMRPGSIEYPEGDHTTSTGSESRRPLKP